jgi:hypothetical protein
MPPFQICKNGFEQLAVSSRPSNSSQLLAGSAMSAYSIEAVIWMSMAQISSTLGLTFLMTPYAHLALLMRLTLLKMMALVGVGMWVSPVKFRRPNRGVSTMSAASPWFQKAGSSSLV